MGALLFFLTYLRNMLTSSHQKPASKLAADGCKIGRVSGARSGKIELIYGHLEEFDMSGCGCSNLEEKPRTVHDADRRRYEQ